MPAEQTIRQELEENRNLSTPERLDLIRQLTELTLARRCYLKTHVAKKYKPRKRPGMMSDAGPTIGDVLASVRESARQ